MDLNSTSVWKAASRPKIKILERPQSSFMKLLNVAFESCDRHAMLHLVETIEDDDKAPAFIENLKKPEVIAARSVLACQHLSHKPINRLVIIKHLAQRNENGRTGGGVSQSAFRELGREMSGKCRLSDTIATHNGDWFGRRFLNPALDDTE